MEALRNAAAAAASYVGYDNESQNTQTSEANRISGGEAPQNVSSGIGNSQSGVEPVSGRLGRGEAGEPYDAGNEEGAAGLGGSSAQNPPGYTSNSGNSAGGLTSGLTSGSRNNHSSSAPLKERAEAALGVGGGNQESTSYGGERGPGFGTSSKDDSTRLGSAVGHGSNPEAHLYNSKNAPGGGGHRSGDDFTDSNIRHEGAGKLPSSLGSDAAAGHSGSKDPLLSQDAARSSSGLSFPLGQGNMSGQSGRNTTDTNGARNTTGTGSTTSTTEKVARKAEEYLPGTTGTTGTTGSHTSHGTTGLTNDTRDRGLAGVGRNEPGYGSTQGSGVTGGAYNTSGSGVSSEYPSSGTSDSTRLTGDRDAGLAGAGAGAGLAGAGLASSGTGHSHSHTTGAGLAGSSGGLTSSHTTGASFGDLADHGCEAEHEGYKPHGGHPIGEDAHQTNDGKTTFLDYRHDPTLPMGREKPSGL